MIAFMGVSNFDYEEPLKQTFLVNFASTGRTRKQAAIAVHIAHE